MQGIQKIIIEKITKKHSKENEIKMVHEKPKYSLKFYFKIIKF